MKRLLSLFILISLQFSVQAQHYQSIFGKQSTSWVFAWSNLPGTAQSTVTVQKDTVVNNLAYKKVVLQGVQIGTGYYDGGLLREDTIAGKVWYKKLYPADPRYPFDTTEVLLFDYNLNLGDTLAINGIYSGSGYGLSGGPVGSYPDSFNVVKRVYYQNNLKHIEFKGPSFEPFTMIEGVGGNFGVIWKEYDGPMTNQYLLCSYKDSIKTSYVNKAFQGNCLLTGISEERPEESISIYPNPAKDQLFIRSASGRKIESCRILNAFGARVSEPKINNQQVIDISALPPGLYILQTTLRNGKVNRQRFMKQQ